MPSSLDVGCQRIPQLLGMPGVQIDLILDAIQAETGRSLSGAPIKVIDEQGLYLLSHGRLRLWLTDAPP
jgi:hypothetical protein